MGIKINLKSRKIDQLSVKSDLFRKKSDFLYTKIDILFGIYLRKDFSKISEGRRLRRNVKKMSVGGKKIKIFTKSTEYFSHGLA